MAINPFAQLPQPKQLVVSGPPESLAIIELRAEELAWAITRPADGSRLTLIADEAAAAQLRVIIAQVGQQQNASLEVGETQLEPIDWVRQVQKDFPPFTVGPFYVHGTHVVTPPPANRHRLLIDAAAAFGTGEHETTAGCLLALARVRKTRRHVPQLLDMGCGTAILAIGGARLWKAAYLTACDNDAVAVQTSALNLRTNRQAGRSRAFVSDGYRSRRVRDRQYEVIVANILAKPLMRMAKLAAQALAPGGTLILSGLLSHQEPMVLSAHRAQGLYLKYRLRRGKWSVLVLQKAAVG